MSARAEQLTRADLKSFDAQSTQIVLEYMELGWTGYISTKGHAIVLSPDGESTEAVSRDSLRGRSGRNQRAALERWKRAANGEEEEAVVLEDSTVLRFKCEACEEWFKSERSLASHQRKHEPTPVCEICGKAAKYMAAHLERFHAPEPPVDPVEAVFALITEIETLRSKVAEYEKRFGPLG